MDKGAYTYPDGAKYEGEWLNRKRHGRGVWARPDGMRYEGEWENDKPNGQGSLSFPNGKKQSGLWKDGKFIGEQQPVEPKGDNMQELVTSQKARIQELEEANQALKLEIKAFTSKVPVVEGQNSDLFEENAFVKTLERTEEKHPLEKPVRKKSKLWLVVVAALLILFVIIIATSGGEKEPAAEPEEILEEQVEEEKDPNTTETIPGGTDSATLGEKNAAKSALNYLSFAPFSYSGLVDQLKFEGFTPEEAVYGVDNCGADWNEQAALMAQNYLDFSSFSRTELLGQLEFEGFTRQQAEYGVQAVGY